MAAVKLIATDLDGTMLDSNGEITDRNLKTLREALARGVTVIICTGRMFRSAKRFADVLELKKPLICYNGAMMRRSDGENLWHQPLDIGMTKSLLEICQKRGVYVHYCVDDVLYVRDENEKFTQDYIRTFGVPAETIGDDLYNPKSAPTKLLAITEGAKESRALARELNERFGDDLYVTRSISNFVEMMNPKANKAACLSKLAETMGIGMDEVMAIGDGENDLEMVTMAGIGVAMGNGVEKLRNAAKYIGPTNDENGVSWAVERFVLARDTTGQSDTAGLSIKL